MLAGSGCAAHGRPDPGTTDDPDISAAEPGEADAISRSPGFGKHTVEDFVVSGGPPNLTDDHATVPAAASSWLVGNDVVESLLPSPVAWPRLIGAPARLRIENPAIPVLVRWSKYAAGDTAEKLDDDRDSFETCAFATKEVQITQDGKCFYWKTGQTIGLYLPDRSDRYNILVVSWPQVRDDSGEVHDESVDAVWTFSR
ncbi:hypothetical protein [Nocardia suismassiliense]|uniref:hypothetical protein n=1 Tax=Nocardia suismassiliense TaxID=2077092 RepID=UPI000D1E077E|nr:hypothetical protein [Nocardia suismassiliense]